MRALPADVTVRLIKIDVPRPTPQQRTCDAGGQPCRVVADDTRRRPHDVEWTMSCPPTARPSRSHLCRRDGTDRVDAAIEAAHSRRVGDAAVEPRGAGVSRRRERAAFIAGARAIDRPRMFDVIDRVRRNPLVIAAAQAEGAPTHDVVLRTGSCPW